MDDVWDTLKWLLVILAVLWVAWFLTGGPERYENRSNPFVTPASPLDTNEVYRYENGQRVFGN